MVLLTILARLFLKSRERHSNEGNTVVESTINQSIYRYKSSITCEILSKMLGFPDLSKTRLTGVLNMAKEGESDTNDTSRIPTTSEKRGNYQVCQKNSLKFSRCILEPNNKFGCIKIKLQLVCRKSLFDII